MNKTMGKFLLTAINCALLALATGCAGVAIGEKVTYHGIKPVYPMPFYMSSDLEVTIDSLTPTLKWEGKEGVQTYDVAVWDTPFKQYFEKKSFKQIMVDNFGENQKENSLDSKYARRPEELGERVFYAKLIAGTSVTVTPELKPNHLYLWSVRSSGTEEWSTYDQYDWLGAAAGQPQSSTGHSYKFRTPNQTAGSAVTPTPTPTPTPIPPSP